MASIGYRVSQDPFAASSMSLAKTLAEAIAPDPTKAIQMDLLRERANAQRLYQQQIQNTMRLQNEKAMRDAEASRSLVGERGATQRMNEQKTNEALSAQTAREKAVPGLAAVFRDQIKMPPLVTADAPDRYAEWETKRAAVEPAVAAIMQSGGNADQMAKAFQAITATPMIVNGSPDQMRRGATLQGNLPTENSVLAAGDTIGTEQKIAAEVAKPQTPIFTDQKDVRLVPDPASPSGYRQERVAGAGPAPRQGPFSGTTVEAQALNIINEIGPKIADGTATVEEQRAYALADRQVNRPQNYEGVQGGKKVVTPITTRAPGFPAPVGAEAQGTVIGENPRATSGEQAKAIQNLELMDVAERDLQKMNPTKLYGIVDIIANNPKRELDAREVMSMIGDPEARRLFNTFLMFGEGRLRGASGAAISATEWAQEFARFMPPPNATEEDIALARQFRRAAIRGQENVAFMNDEARRAAHRRALLSNGINLGEGEMVDPGEGWTPPAAAAPNTPAAPAGRNWVVRPDGSVGLE